VGEAVVDDLTAPNSILKVEFDATYAEFEDVVR
jgi:hypothetical protein